MSKMNTYQQWLPTGLADDLVEIGFTADLIRAELYWFWDGGAGACLPVSGFLSFLAFQNGIDQRGRLVRGEFDGKSHWWVRFDEYIFDASISQFNSTDIAVQDGSDGRYVELESWPFGHTTYELVQAETRRAFTNDAFADEFVVWLFELHDQAKRLAAKN